MKNGFNSIPDLVLSIGYENGSLQDIGQKQNYGAGKSVASILLGMISLKENKQLKQIRGKFVIV